MRIARFALPAAIAIAMAVLGLGGCSSGAEREARPRPTVAPGEFGAPDCFLGRSVRNFEVLDDRNLIIFAPGKSNAYHVQVNPPSPHLRDAETLAFDGRNSRICGYAGDELLIAGPGAGAPRMSVTGVFRLDATALEGLQARFGKMPAPGLQQPQPGAGAEIERELGSPPPD